MSKTKRKTVRQLRKELERCPDQDMEVVVNVPDAKPGHFVPIASIGWVNILDQNQDGNPPYNDDREVITINC